jgi:hypothetical protein
MIDQEIREALNVDPSPEFLARVRAGIAREPAPSMWRWSWGLAAACALGAAVVGAIVLTQAREKAHVPPVTQTAEHATSAPATAMPEAQSMPKKRSAEAFARPTRPRATSAVSGFSRSTRLRAALRFSQGPTVAQKPDVLLDPAEQAALRRLIAGVRDGRIDLAAARQDPTRAPMDLDPIVEIVIAPIAIDPLAPLPGAEGVRP